jgi:hypothetical protein
MLLARSGLSLWLFLAATSPCAAQSVRFTGVSVERYHRNEARLTSVTVRRSDLGPRGFGIDAALGLEPTYLQELLFNFDAGVARGFAAGPATVMVKAGVAGFFAAQQVELYPGVQVGAAVLIPLQRRLELRTDLVRRRYWRDDGSALDVWSIGIGFAVRAGK